MIKLKNAVIDSISVSNTDTDKGQMLDDTNQAINAVPVHFTQRYDTAVFNAQYRKLIKQGVTKESPNSSYGGLRLKNYLKLYRMIWLLLFKHFNIWQKTTPT